MTLPSGYMLNEVRLAVYARHPATGAPRLPTARQLRRLRHKANRSRKRGRRP
jgi:hypothetical protein